MIRITFLTLMILSNLAMAQVEVKTTEKTTSQPPEHKLSVILEGAPIILKGAGLKATYKIAEKFSLGGIANIHTLSTSESETEANSSIYSNEYKHEITQYGLIVDFFPMNSVDSRGLYISAGVTNARVKSTVKDSLFGENKAESTKTGGLLKVGYQFVIHTGDLANIVFQVGGGYGNAGTVRWKYYSGTETKLEDGLLLDLNAGVQF